MVVWEALEAACSNDNCKIYCSDNYYGNIVCEPSIIVNHGIISRNRLKKHNTSKYEFQTFFPSKNTSQVLIFERHKNFLGGDQMKLYHTYRVLQNCTISTIT